MLSRLQSPVSRERGMVQGLALYTTWCMATPELTAACPESLPAPLPTGRQGGQTVSGGVREIAEKIPFGRGEAALRNQ
jgi:hypothetical protein